MMQKKKKKKERIEKSFEKEKKEFFLSVRVACIAEQSKNKKEEVAEVVDMKSSHANNEWHAPKTSMRPTRGAHGRAERCLPRGVSAPSESRAWIWLLMMMIMMMMTVSMKREIMFCIIA